MVPGKSGYEPFTPTKKKVDDIVDALAASAHHSLALGQPAWLNGCENEWAADEIMVCRNGLLHLPTKTLLDPTPMFFTTSAVDFEYRPEAAAPSRWLAFLEEIFGGDREASEVLQEWFGYCLTQNTSLQKMLLLVGPPRSGKGTIGRILTKLLGKDNVAGPTLGSFASNFGLSPLIGKSLAIIADARVNGRSDQAVIIERLLSISGEDAQTIDRKYREPWTGRLTARLMILTNELPKFVDSSGALASRFIILSMKKSFLGNENPGLEAELLKELPGILNWAIEGWKRLIEAGRFLQPSSSETIMEELTELQSPIMAFVNEMCAVGEGCSVEVSRLYCAWEEWCERNGREAGSSQTFGKNLRAAHPEIVDQRPRIDGQRTRMYHGIGLGLNMVGGDVLVRPRG